MSFWIHGGAIDREMAILRYALIWGLFLALMLVNGLAVAAAPLEQIKALHQKGQLKQAYELATQHLADAEGDPAFDFLYGQIAIDSGNVGYGVFALERVLLLQPDHHLARLELARGYFLLGQKEKAEAEFKKVLAVNPPEAVQEKVARYLKAMRQKPKATAEKDRRSKTQTSAYAQLTAGYDSNINSASSEASFTTPTLGTGTLSDESLSAGAYFGEVELGGRVIHQIAKGRHLFAGLDLEQRIHDYNSEYELGSVDIHAGVNMVEGKKLMRLTASAQHMDLDFRSYLDLANVTLESQYKMSAKTILNGYLRGGVISYPNLDDRDAYTAGAGIGFTRALSGRYKPTFSAMVFLGNQEAMDDTDTNEELSNKQSIGVSLSDSMKLSSRSSLNLSVLWQKTEYKVEDSAFMVRREDDFLKLGVGYRYKLSDDWQLRLDVSNSRQSSNIPINEYNRTEYSIGIRYEL